MPPIIADLVIRPSGFSRILSTIRGHLPSHLSYSPPVDFSARKASGGTPEILRRCPIVPRQTATEEHKHGERKSNATGAAAEAGTLSGGEGARRRDHSGYAYQRWIFIADLADAVALALVLSFFR
jgi:hypothetical protein